MRVAQDSALHHLENALEREVVFFPPTNGGVKTKEGGCRERKISVEIYTTSWCKRFGSLTYGGL